MCVFTVKTEQFCRDGLRIISPESVLQDDCPQSAGLEELIERSGADEETLSTMQLFRLHV